MIFLSIHGLCFVFKRQAFNRRREAGGVESQEDLRFKGGLDWRGKMEKMRGSRGWEGYCLISSWVGLILNSKV